MRNFRQEVTLKKIMPRYVFQYTRQAERATQL